MSIKGTNCYHMQYFLFKKLLLYGRGTKKCVRVKISTRIWKIHNFLKRQLSKSRNLLFIAKRKRLCYSK